MKHAMLRIGALTLSVLLISSTLSWGAITEVGGGSQRATATTASADSVSKAFPANVAANSLIVVGGNLWDASAANTSVAVTDSVGTSYTAGICTAVASGTTTPFLAFGITPSAGANTVVVNPGGASDKISFAIDEFTGTHTTTPLDVDGGSSTGTGTGTGSDSITTVTANDLVIGVLGVSSADVLTPGASYTQIGEDEVSLSGFNFQFAIVTTAQPYTVDWSGVDVDWSACTLAFKVPAAGGTTVRTLSLTGVGQ